MAASGGAESVVKKLLSFKKININEQDKTKTTSIYLAAFSGHSGIVLCFLQAGAKANFEFGSPWGWSPLHASYDNCEILTRLLDAKAQINAHNDDGDTTLACAVRNGYQDSTELLLDNDADLFITDREERTSLHIAADTNNKEIIELLLKYALPIRKKNSQDRDGKTPLHVAAQNFDIEIIKAMLKYVSPGDADIKDSRGKTRLMTESDGDVQKFLQSDVDVLALDDNKHTLLWYAIGNDNVKIANLIFEVNLGCHTETAKSLYDHAVGSKSIKGLELLWLKIPSKLRDSDERVFKLVASEESNLLIKRILQSDNGKGWRDEHGWTLTDISENIPSSDEKRLVDPQWERPSSLSVTDKSWKRRADSKISG